MEACRTIPELAASLLSSGWTIHLPVAGVSMKPLLRPGFVLRVVPTGEAPRVGEIVLYRSRCGRLVAHRVLASYSESILTKGDALATFDGPVDRSRILGQVVAVAKPRFIPLRSRLAIVTGLVLSRIYPALVQWKKKRGQSVGG